MATIDLTAENSSARQKHGIKSFVHTHGPFETHYVVMDEKKMAERFLIDSVTAANDDVYELIQLAQGDVIISGWAGVLVAGGTAGATIDWGTDVDPNGLASVLDADATPITIDQTVNAGGTSSYPEILIVDNTVDLTVATQILIRSVALSAGRWGLNVLVYKGSALLDLGFENYVGDPNTTPQVIIPA